MLIESAFRPLIDLENAMGELYWWLADALEADAEASTLFRKMASEEKGHAVLLDYQRRIARQNLRLGGEVDLDLVFIVAAIARTKSFRVGVPAPTVEQALALALQLEEGAAEAHMKNALREASPELAELLRGLGSEDRQHVERLRVFARARGLAAA